MAEALPDQLDIRVPVGGRVLVASDLLLGAEATPASLAATTELGQALDAWDGAGVVVVAGNLLDMCVPDAGGRAASPGTALGAHQRLVRSLTRFGGPEGRRIVVIPGSRDRALAWDDEAAGQVRALLGAELALAVDLVVETGAGIRRVRVESGTRFDAAWSVGDPRNPAESPLGQHVLADVLPGMGAASWSAGRDRLADPAALPRFLVSRTVYRGAIRYAWWLLAPLVVALAVKYPLTYALVRHPGRLLAGGGWAGRLLLVGLTTVVDVLLVAAVLAWTGHRVWAAVGGAAARPSGPATNDAARAAARAMVTAGGAGLVTGQSLRPELTRLGPGFYACTGAVGEVVEEHKAWLGLPSVYLGRRVASWVEVEAGAELHVRLLHGTGPVPGASVLERLLARDRPRAVAPPAVVAAFPQGPDWPEEADPGLRQRRVRRWAAIGIALGGLIDLLSAVTPPLRGRLEFLQDWVPLSVSQAADAVVALAGLALLFLARGVRRGQRRAWSVSVVVLGSTAVLHLVKGIDVEEAVLSLVVMAYMLLTRDAFAARADRLSLRRAFTTLAVGALVAVGVAVAAVELTLELGRHTRMLSFNRAVEAVGGRLVGVHLVPLPHRLDVFMTPALVAVTFGVATAALALASRPVVSRHAAPDDALGRAREVVGRWGAGTLDYFALRSDKSFFFSGDTAVAYGVYAGVCLVSPDPVGPASERSEVWASFRDFAYSQGWSVGVVGAGEDWLPVYRASGMHDMYVGDEAVVDVTRLDLSGGRHKSLRQAVNRVAKYGYTVSFHDPRTLDPEQRRAVESVMDKSRRGDVERGFSMTLGRVFDPEDRGLLLAVAWDSEGVPVAFCQYVPAPGIDGYSLDLMRRDAGEHPNGLIDFLVVETARHLRERGMRGLGLNFATMRAVLAGESGDSLPQRVERWVLRRLSGSMQIESLWRFNAKFDPEWLPRYLVYDAPEHLLPIGMAVARAESFWELPLVGRFLMPSAT